MWSDGDPPSSAAELEALDERTALFVALAERLIHGEALDEPERRAHLLRLLTSLMSESREKARAEVIAKLAEMPSPPKDVALALARDRAALAAPLLRKAPFSQNELIELVMRTGAEHHIEIARRADLTLDVWLALARAAAKRARAPEPGQAPGERGERTREAVAPAEAHAPAPPSAPPAPTPDRVRNESAASTEETMADPGIAVPPLSELAFTSDAAETEKAPAADRMPPEAAPPRERGFRAIAPLEDPGPHAWRFETDRQGRIVRLSPNARLAFGDIAPSLVGEPFAQVLQLHSAVPAGDEIGEAMARWAPLHDLVVETMVGDGPSRRWRIRAQPRFSFPDGRFEGYVGTATDEDARRTPAGAQPQDSEVLLDRLERAADRLAKAASTPELRDYALAMQECVAALRALPLGMAKPGRPSAPPAKAEP